MGTITKDLWPSPGYAAFSVKSWGCGYISCSSIVLVLWTLQHTWEESVGPGF